MVCIDFSNDWFSFFPNKILGKILFSKEKVCNFLAKFLQNAFCISLSLFFFPLHWSFLQNVGFSLQYVGFSCCGVWTLEHMGSVVMALWLLQLGHMGLATPHNVEHA